MSSKVVVFIAFLAVANAGTIAPEGRALADIEGNHIPQYTFGYDVQDPFTGDSKSQVETRNGDVVQGSYSLNDPDGTRRTVDYTADAVNGFNAVVRKTPLVAAAPVAAPVVASVANVEAVAPAVAKAAPEAASVSESTSTIVHGPVVAHYPAPYGYTPYSVPVVNHLAYSSHPVSYAWFNPTYYPPLSHYRTLIHY